MQYSNFETISLTLLFHELCKLAYYVYYSVWWNEYKQYKFNVNWLCLILVQVGAPPYMYKSDDVTYNLMLKVSICEFEFYHKSDEVINMLKR